MEKASHLVIKQNIIFLDQIIEIRSGKKAYSNILRDNLNSSIQKLELEGRYFFQQDNDPKHTASC